MHTPAGNCIAISASLPADILTPVIAYLRLTNGARSGESFLLESVVRGETAGRWSFVGACESDLVPCAGERADGGVGCVDPKKVLRTGEGQPLQGDPLVHLERELGEYKYIKAHGLPSFTGEWGATREEEVWELMRFHAVVGGAIGYVSYDCVQYFEPKTARPLEDPIGMPEAVFLISDTLVAFDHLFQTVRIVSQVLVPSSTAPEHVQSTIEASYAAAQVKIADIIKTLTSNDPLPMPEQPKIVRPPKEAVSNVGEKGYKEFVSALKGHIVKGDIIQAVPSQRLRRETTLHPFNAYR